MVKIIRVDRLTPELQDIVALYNCDAARNNIMRGWINTLSHLTNKEDIEQEFNILYDAFAKVGWTPPTLKDYE